LAITRERGKKQEGFWNFGKAWTQHIVSFCSKYTQYIVAHSIVQQNYPLSATRHALDVTDPSYPFPCDDILGHLHQIYKAKNGFIPTDF